MTLTDEDRISPFRRVTGVQDTEAGFISISIPADRRKKWNDWSVWERVVIRGDTPME